MTAEDGLTVQPEKDKHRTGAGELSGKARSCRGSSFGGGAGNSVKPCSLVLGSSDAGPAGRGHAGQADEACLLLTVYPRSQAAKAGLCCRVLVCPVH